MTLGLSDLLLSQLSAFVADQLGLHFPPERWSDLERGLRSAAREFDVEEMELCARWLLSSPPLTRSQIQILASNLTVGETYFFREQRSFEILGVHILPELIRARQATEKRLRIWSAGCCTGEEPYSIAILLDRLFPEVEQWRPTILATDVNPHFLRKAAAGVFGEWSFRGAPPWLKANYFTQIAERRFEILPRIRQRVTFAYLNLAQDAYPSLATDTNAMDVIFCRNVLMYFATERACQIAERFRRSLLESGWLIVSPSELSPVLFSQFVSTQFEGAILYRKANQSSLVPVAMYSAQPPTVQPHEHPARPNVAAVDPVPVLPPPILPEESFARAAPSVEQDSQTVEGQRASHQKALALFESGDYAAAAQLLKADVVSVSRSPEGFALLARICANMGELGEARSWADKALSADKLNAGLHYLRAIILREQGSDEEAIASLKRTLYLAPDFVLAHFALSSLARQHGKSKEVAKHLTIVLTLLKSCPAGEVLPYSDGLTAERLAEMIHSTMAMSNAA